VRVRTGHQQSVVLLHYCAHYNTVSGIFKIVLS